MKNKNDFKQWISKHSFEYHRITGAHSWTEHTTPSNFRIEEHLILKGILTEPENFYNVCWIFPDTPETKKAIKEYKGRFFKDPYSEEEKIRASFDTLEDAWLFCENVIGGI